ncbi:MAG: DUF6174 domain-containing protein [Gammaproteobacteria bacterium]
MAGDRLFVIAAFLASAAVSADEALIANQATWTSAAITTYEYRYRKVCDCHRDTPADTIVAVENSAVVNVHYERDDYVSEMPVNPDDFQWFRTIDDLFSLVATAEENATTLRVSYDETLGYPAYIYIDYDHSLIGDEVELEVVEVQVSE